MPSSSVAVLLFINLIITSTAYRILVVYPTPDKDHQRGQQAITQKLAEIGHEITLISPFPPGLTEHPNITHINVSELHETTKVSRSMKDFSLIEFLNIWRHSGSTMVKTLMANDGVKHLLKEKPHFDTVIVELTGYTTLHAFGPFFNAPLIGLAPMETSPMIYHERGNPTHPVLHPGFGAVAVHTGRPNFVERLRCFYISCVSFLLSYDTLNPLFDGLTQEYFNLSFNSVELIQMVDFQIELVSPVLQNVRPLLPNTIQIGFVQFDTPKSLSEDLQTFMDSSARGVIYVSFDSTFTSVESALKETFASLDYDVIWESDVKLMKDIPQSVLAHKNLRLFITHGAHSMEEFIARGVPAVVIPMFRDQEYNAVMVEELGVGKCILKEDATKEKLIEAITEVIKNSSYRERTRELYRLAMDTPLPPLETAVWWIEYIIRNKGASHLKYPGADMPWYQWLLLDILLAHLLVFWILSKVSQKIYRVISIKIKQD